MPSQFRIITLDSKVSEETFQTIRPSDNKNRIVIEGDESGARLTIHKNRVLSADSIGKAVALRKGSAVKAVCPKCSNVIEVTGNKIVCPDHGEFETTSHDQKLQSVNMVKRSKPQKDRSKNTMDDQTNDAAIATGTPATDTNIGTIVDLDEIKGYGDELWTKPQLNFDHVSMDVRAHVLLSDNPVRKLCFNTYDGTLGKKKQLEDLHLEEFKGNKPIQDKKFWHALKGTLDDARQHLEKKGYTRA